MEKTTRRNFAKGLGLSGLFLAGVAGYKEAKERIVYKQDEIPTNIVLETYAVDGRFEKAVEQPIQYSGSIVINDAGKRFLLIVPKGDNNFSLAINREYEIVIDNSVEYRVSKIVSSDRPNLGCPLESAVVNTCTVTGSGRISFDQSCR